jgi:uncharacterized membrane protein HdeD (DUF308 family)
MTFVHVGKYANWNRNKTTTTLVGQIAKQHKSKSKCNFILIYWIAFFQIFLQIFQIFFSIELKSKYVGPAVSAYKNYNF